MVPYLTASRFKEELKGVFQFKRSNSMRDKVRSADYSNTYRYFCKTLRNVIVELSIVHYTVLLYEHAVTIGDASVMKLKAVLDYWCQVGMNLRENPGLVCRSNSQWPNLVQDQTSHSKFLATSS